jgi:hypothetical protein
MMAHWAEVDENNIVLRVIVTSNNEPDEGYQWILNNLGGRWIKTSYNTLRNTHILGDTPLRGNYAGIGYSYNEQLDAFVPPKLFESWIFNSDTFNWDPPILYPNDGQPYIWNEETTSWDVVELATPNQ